jgi:high-affinity nickel permease
MGWATVWRTFSQTHMVTLLATLATILGQRHAFTENFCHLDFTECVRTMRTKNQL